MTNNDHNIINKGLEQLRNKLLDISGRSPLISFRHSEKAKSQIQAIHTPLECLFSALKDEKDISFKALPEPKLEISLNDGIETNQIKFNITPKEYALSLEINPSYDLELKYHPASEDLAIQTLLFPDQFLKKMTGFLDVQKLDIEETGVNSMYACFGFLEWYESSSSKIAKISPLLMIPILVERKFKRQQSVFQVCSSGEEIRDNPALAERLKKDFGLQLPPLTETITLQEYFSDLKTIIKDQPRWKIQQRLTLARVSFSKILMYYDLDPKNWPLDDSIFDQPLVKDLFMGSESVLQESFASDAHLDETDLASPVPLIISDLDSSQLSAVSDAMNNKSFVIEGPPGTGKSQTITNIIAAAISEGKSVLFVAEKLVALQVVKNRLDEAGLGQFCLELHGTKTQKSKFYEELKVRLDLNNLRSNDKLFNKVNRMIDNHSEMKHKLNLYASTMGMCFGVSDHTFHEYFWLYQKQKDKLPLELVGKTESIFLKNISQLSENELFKFKEAATQWISCHQEMDQEFGNIKKHPWYGFQAKMDESYKIKNILQNIDPLKESFTSLNQHANWFIEHTTNQEVNNLSDIFKINDHLRYLFDYLKKSSPYNTEVFIQIKSQDDISFLTHFCQQKQRINTLIEDLEKFVPISDFQTPKQLTELIHHLSFLWSECELEGLQDWNPSQIEMVLQTEELKDLSINFPIQEIAKLIHNIHKTKQQWQILEKECNAFFLVTKKIDRELLNDLKNIHELTIEANFENIPHGKWSELYEIIRVFLQDLKYTPGANFDEILLDLPQHIIEEKEILSSLNGFLNIEKLQSKEFYSSIKTLSNIVKSVNNNEITLSNLNNFKVEKEKIRDCWLNYRKKHLDIISFISPNWTEPLSIKTLKTLSEVYKYIEKTSRHVLIIKTCEACNELHQKDLQEAIFKYNALRQKRINIESKIKLDINPHLISQSISALKNAGFFSWLNKETREAKRIFRENSIDNINYSNNEMMMLFGELQSFNNEYAKFIEEPRFTIFTNILEKIGESRLEEIVDLLNWSAKVNELLRGNHPLFVATKRFIFESDIAQLDSLFQLFENNNLQDSLEDISNHLPLAFIDDFIENLKQEIENLEKLHTVASEVGFETNVMLEKGEDAYQLYNRYIEIQKQVDAKTNSLKNRLKTLDLAFDIFKKINLDILPESFTISKFINLIEGCILMKEEMERQERILSSKKNQIHLFSERCRLKFLHQDISFNLIDSILQKVKNLQLALYELNYSEIFSPLCAISDAKGLAEVTSACDFYLNLINKEVPHWLIKYIQNENFDERLNELQKRFLQLEKISSPTSTELENFIESGEINTKIWFGNETLYECSLENITIKLEKLFTAKQSLNKFVRFNIIADKLDQYGIKRLCTILLNQKINTDLIPVAIDFVFYHSIIRLIQKEHPILDQLDYQDLNSLRQRFAEIDQKLIGSYRELAAAKIMENEVDPGTKKGSRQDWTGKALLEHEVSKKRKHRPIRGLLKNASEAMLALKPCFMMSPLSVVQYLAPAQIKFDLIVIDEASQVKPEDAIGTLARGKQVIIVGDPKQLPPTDFWKKDVECVEDDELEDIGNEESILDLATTIYQPMRRLRWHYRSQHESLISFSNQEFYDNNLIIFPSPNFGDDKLGLEYRYINNAHYSRGGDKTNLEEATQLVNAVEIFIRNNLDRSIGIITMNVQQRELINEIMNARFAKSDILEDYRTKWNNTLEEFFIKNLENVQGDERDVIFISTVYGKDKATHDEKLNQNFGPINKANGHRRLNVLFTRAKQKIIVFSSLDPDEIRVTDDSPRGLRVFKNYLKFAKTGNLNFSKITGRDYGSEFERCVSDSIKNWGYEVDSQVGVGSYFLDLAVVHPHKPGKHMLAIECDGATYHSSRSARDRDRLRQQALERMGWCIHRIWSTDWFRNPRAELDQLKKLLQLKANEP